MNDIINNFHEQHEVEYLMFAVVDDEVVVRFSDKSSFDSLSGFAALADEQMEKYIRANAEDRAAMLDASAADNAIERERNI